MTPEILEYRILTGLLIFTGICTIFTLIRSVIGPRVADRLIAVNMTNTLAVIALSDLAVMTGEGYLADVCLLYVTLGFLAVTVLCKAYINVIIKKKGGGGDDK